MRNFDNTFLNKSGKIDTYDEELKEYIFKIKIDKKHTKEYIEEKILFECLSQYDCSQALLYSFEV